MIIVKFDHVFAKWKITIEADLGLLQYPRWSALR